MRFICALITFVAFSFASSCDDPGKGDLARAGFEYCSTMISSLEAYRCENGRYPDSLGQLSIFADDQKVPQEINGLEYGLDSAGNYALTFVYNGPGVNRCTFESTTKDWACEGYY